MQLLETAVKKSLPSLVGALKDWFEISLTIKLFGVKVFEFRWPPKDDSSKDVDSSLIPLVDGSSSSKYNL